MHSRNYGKQPPLPYNLYQECACVSLIPPCSSQLLCTCPLAVTAPPPQARTPEPDPHCEQQPKPRFQPSTGVSHGLRTTQRLRCRALRSQTHDPAVPGVRREIKRTNTPST
eukprot:3541138-Rhodomonas_salina.4